MQHEADAPKILDDLRKAKLVETRAKERRVELESALIGALGFEKPEGQATYEVDGFKVTCKQPLMQSVDTELFESLELADKGSLVRRKYSLDSKAYKSASDADRIAMSGAITTKPGKVSVTIKEVKS